MALPHSSAAEQLRIAFKSKKALNSNRPSYYMVFRQEFLVCLAWYKALDYTNTFGPHGNPVGPGGEEVTSLNYLLFDIIIII